MLAIDILLWLICFGVVYGIYRLLTSRDAAPSSRAPEIKANHLPPPAGGRAGHVPLPGGSGLYPPARVSDNAVNRADNTGVVDPLVVGIVTGIVMTEVLDPDSPTRVTECAAAPNDAPAADCGSDSSSSGGGD